MRHRSRQWLEEELSQTSEQLEIFRALERAADERHAVENTPETEADLLRDWRARLVKELDRRAVEEKGWAPDCIGGVEVPGTGRAGRLRIGPHPLLPERGFVIYDRELATVTWVRKVPTPARASELLRKHGAQWEEELMSHGLSPVPQEEEGKP